MKSMKGLYVCFVIMFFVQLINITIFDSHYSGISMFISLGVFIVGTGFFVTEKQLKGSKKE